jgi:hypothetical protein
MLMVGSIFSSFFGLLRNAAQSCAKCLFAALSLRLCALLLLLFALFVRFFAPFLLFFAHEPKSKKEQ